MNDALDSLTWHAKGAARTAWETIRLFVDDQALTWAGAIGLYLFLSVPPFIVASVYIGGLFFPSGEVEAFVIEQVTKFLPAEQELMQGIVAELPDNAAAGTFSVVLLLFSGSRAFAALTSAINVMWRRVDRLTFWRRQALRIGMLVVTLFLLMAAGLAEALISALVDGGGDGNEIWLLDWQILPSLLLAAFLLIAYKLLPREPVSWRHAAVGAALATVGVRLAQAALGLLADAGTLQTPYGDLAGVALLATWSLVVGIVILFGAAMVAVLHGKRTVDGEADERFSRGS